MALPKIDLPTYELKLISNNKSIRFRPFLVKEQKLFLMASESDDAKETIRAIKQVIKNCVIDDIDVDSLAIFDLEWLFMNLRARSIEEVVELRYKCNNKLKDENGEEKKCIGVVDFQVNLLEVKPTINPNHTDKIQLTENLGICLKYPTFDLVEKYEDKEESEVMMEILVDCIDYIYDKEQIYYSKDTSRDELQEFVDNLQQKDLEKIKNFFDTVPEIKKELHFDCPKCGYKDEISVKGLQNFFV
jgi:hypothetical protein